MNNVISIVIRLAWMISFTLGMLFSFLLCSFDTGMYSSAASNFFEWGWIWAIIFTLVLKKIFLSDAYLSNLEGGTFTPQSSREVPTEIPYNIDPNTRVGIEENSIAFEHQVSEPQITLPVEVAQFDVEKIEPLPPPPPREPSWIVTFFSDRPLAKIGGIILFLGAFFFLSLVWSVIGAVGKVLIGLIFGFFLYGLGVWMDKRGHASESRTLLGVGIAINTLTILSGRWIIGDGSETLFSDSITLFFLLLNTIFAVVTGLVYNSRTFLVFSFVFAYLIPFLVGSNSESTILMMLYVLVISLGGYLLVWFFSMRNEREDDMKWLLRTVILGSVILLSLTSLGIENQFELIVSAGITLILTSVGIFISRKSESKDESLPSLLISAYIILACSILGIGDGDQGTIFIIFLSIVPLMIYTGFFLIQSVAMIFSWILLFPIILSIILLGIFGAHAIIFIILPVVFLYAIAGLFLVSVLSQVFQYIFYLAITFFLVLCALTINFGSLDITDTERMIIALSAILFFLISLWSSFKNRLRNLSLVALISSAIILAFTLVPASGASWVYFIIFMTIVFVYPFTFGKSLLKENTASFISYQVIANLFLLGELFYLGKGIWFTGESTSLITLGVIVFLLSFGSLLYTFLLIRSGGEDIGSLSAEEKYSATALLGIPLSLFSIAIAITFSESALIVSMAWIIESTILAYYTGKSKNKMVFIGSLVLLAIGILRLLPFFDTIHAATFPSIIFQAIPIIIIALNLYLGRSFLPREDEEPTVMIYDILHIIGIAMVGYAIMEMVPHTNTGWSLLGLNIFLMASVWFYTKISSKIISLWMTFLTVVIFFYHFARVETLNMSFGPVLLQLASLALGTYAIWYLKAKDTLGKYVFVYVFIMVLLITSLYVNQITDNVFVVTIYLTFVATFYLLHGINNDSEKYRTIGLYIGTVVLIKILLYDIWAGVDNLIIRVVALMITGGVMIALSQLYGRRVNRSWKEEFSYENFFSGPSLVESSPAEVASPIDDMPFDEAIASDLRNFDVSHIVSIDLRDGGGETILSSRRVGIIRIANYITMKLGKTQFQPQELENVLQNMLPHIQSSLPKKDLESMLEKIHAWVNRGGNIVIHHKKSGG